MDASEIVRLVSQGQLWQAVSFLGSMADADFPAIAQEICRQAADPADTLALVNSLVNAPAPAELTDMAARLTCVEASRHLAVHIAAESAGQDWEEFIPVIQTLAAEASYRVEEALVRLVSRIASKNFASSKSFWHECLTEDTGRVAACVLRGLAASEAPVLEVLELFSNVIADIRKDIRHNLGPRALAELGRREPQAVYSKLRDWAGRTEEFARWNVAKALATPLGGVYVEQAMDVLEHLAADERPAVWRTAAEAVAQIAQRRPAYVLPILKRWRTERARLRCAELVLCILSKR